MKFDCGLAYCFALVVIVVRADIVLVSPLVMEAVVVELMARIGIRVVTMTRKCCGLVYV